MKLPLHGGPNMPVLATFGGGGVPRNRQSSRKRPAETRHGCIRWIWYRGGAMPRPYALVGSEKHVIVSKSSESTVRIVEEAVGEDQSGPRK